MVYAEDLKDVLKTLFIVGGPDQCLPQNRSSCSILSRIASLTQLLLGLTCRHDPHGYRVLSDRTQELVRIAFIGWDGVKVPRPRPSLFEKQSSPRCMRVVPHVAHTIFSRLSTKSATTNSSEVVLPHVLHANRGATRIVLWHRACELNRKVKLTADTPMRR